MRELFPKASEKIFQWAFNGEFGRNFANIFDLQMWCFGCDIRNEKGNLLLQSGFSRYQPEGKITGSSHYSKKLFGTGELHLWGFAVVVTDQHHGICLRRHERVPTFADAPVIKDYTWRPHELPPFSYPKSDYEKGHANQLLLLCALEFGRYEDKIQRISRSDYRSNCLSSRRNYRKYRGITLLEAWNELHEKLSGEIMPL
jgi:hypothetical protein